MDVDRRMMQDMSVICTPKYDVPRSPVTSNGLYIRRKAKKNIGRTTICRSCGMKRLKTAGKEFIL